MTRQRLHRSGFTLLELLLTLAIATVVAAVVIPQLDILLTDRRLDRGGDLMRIEMTKARVDAMRQGRTLMMEMATGASDFRVKPFVSLSDATETNQTVTSTSALLSGAEQAVIAAPTQETTTTQQLTLPEGVVFGSVSVASSARSVAVGQAAAANPEMLPGPDEQPAAYSTPVLFYPDGTTSNAAVEVKHPESGSLLVKLRGITGEVTVQRSAADEASP